MLGFGPSRPQSVTVSVGVAVMNPATTDATATALIAAADLALLSAKRTGRNRIMMGGEPAEARTGALVTLVPSLRRSA